MVYISSKRKHLRQDFTKANKKRHFQKFVMDKKKYSQKKKLLIQWGKLSLKTLLDQLKNILNLCIVRGCKSRDYEFQIYHNKHAFNIYSV